MLEPDRPEPRIADPGPPEPAAIPPPPRGAFLTLWQGVAMVFLLYLTLFLCPLCIRTLLDGAGIEIGMLALNVLGNTLAFILVMPIAVALGRRTVRESFPFRPFPPRLLPLMTMIILGWLVVALKLDLIVQRFIPVPEEFSDFFLELVSRRGNPVLQVLLLVVVAPLTEELFFRGVLLQGFLKGYRLRTAVVASALLFALTHGNPWQFVPTFVVGLYFAWWCAGTGSLWPALFGHALNNGLPWLLLFVRNGAGMTQPPVEEIPLGPGAVEIFGLLLMVTGTVLLARQFRAAGRPPTGPALSGPPSRAGNRA